MIARPRATRVLAYLAEHPGLTAAELGRALGLRGQMYRTLRDMELRAEVIAEWRTDPEHGKPLRRWRVAPPGTVPPPPTEADLQEEARRRERDRASAARRRARAGAPLVLLSSADLRRAACAADPGLFFSPDAGEFADEKEARQRKAMAICAGCPVRPACYAAAAGRGERWGIWGGADFEVTASATSRKEAKAS